MTPQTSRTLPWMILLTLALMPIEISHAAARLPKSEPTISLSNQPSTKIAQANADLQRRLQEQREAERVLKEGERLKREVRDNGYNNRGLERQVGEQVNKVRESGSNPQQVREADAELNRLRQQNNQPNYYYDRYYYPYYTTAPIIFAPGFYRNEIDYQTPFNPSPASRPAGRIGQSDAPRDTSNSTFSLLVSSGFKDGKIAPAIGLKYNSIGFEVAGIFNQDRLPGSVNDFPLPSNFLFTDLGLKKLSPQVGIDVLGFLAVDPRAAVYGSVGLYFQNIARIAQSQATNDLYKQTDDTETTGAIGGGVIYQASDSIDLGLGYHSLRGLTARIGISF